MNRRKTLRLRQFETVRERNTYRLIDIEHQGAVVDQYYAMMKEAKIKYAEKHNLPVNNTTVMPFNLSSAHRHQVVRVARYYGRTSKYMPHQGKQEKARRRAQNAKRLQQASQGA